MHVIACDPALRADTPGVGRADIDDAIGRADHLSLHVPLTPQTRGLISRHMLGRAKPGLNLVNVSRGAVAPLDALLHGLESGALGGVALDVYDPEPPDPRHPLLARAELICSPHALSLTPAANRAVFRAMSEGMAAVLDGGRAPAVANPAVYEGEAT
jgi:phosphoglycerate dehydrogenase-like enzyme